MNLSQKHIVLIAIAIFGLGIAMVSTLVIFNSAEDRPGFASERAHFEAIVAEARHQMTLDDTLIAFRLQHPDDPKSLKPVGNAADRPLRGQGAGSVWAMRRQGVLEVWIETIDEGHAGEFGYVFQENDGPVGWDVDKYGERWEVGAPVEAHWWAISNRMD